MPGKPITIGPFTGGLNNVSSAGESRDTEVVDLINLEVTVDGALTSRPAMEVIPSSALPAANTLGWEVLGIYRVTAAEWYLIVTQPKDASTNVDTTVKAYKNGIFGTGEQVTIIKQSTGLNNRVSSMVQFKDYLYFNVDTGATDTGFKWRLGDAVGGTAISTMPRGSVMITWKTRIWISGTGSNADGDRIWFSTIDRTLGARPDTYGAQDFFDVAPGESGFITAMIPSFNNLIVFKSDGTYRYSFPADPSKGSIDKISGNVGASGRNAVVDFENYIYVYDQGRVYELVNSNYTQINRVVNFAEDSLSVDLTAPGIDISIVNRRLIIRYFNSVYAFNIDTKAWSQWRSVSGVPGEFIELPANSDSAVSSTYIAASRGVTRSTGTSPKNLIRLVDRYPDQIPALEVMDCYFQTKGYDYKAPGNFKRLYWAGIDIKSSRPITIETRPVVKQVPVTWGEMEAFTFDQMAAGTWGNPLSFRNISVAQIDLLPEDENPSENGRYFKKFAGAMRFRQVSYVVRMSTLGTLSTGPIKFFTITTYVNTKQEVVDAST